MRSGRIAIVAAMSACAGTLILQQAAARHRDAAPRIRADQATIAPAAPSPTTTATIPSPAGLLAQAFGSSEAKGSVLEYGAFKSSNNAIFDGFTFWAKFSWQHQGFRDWHTFAQAAYLNKDLGYATDVRRIASGPWLAERVHGRWSCNHVTAVKNSALWQSPNFPLQSLRLIGATTVSGRRVWDIRGFYVHKFSGQVGRFQTDVFIDEQSGLFLKAVEIGRVTAKSGKSARVTGKASYSSYGKPVAVKLPAACKS